MTLICLAIIIDESVSSVNTVGKKRNTECNLPMLQIDRFTYTCEKGHIKKTEAFEYKGYLDFISPQKLEVRNKLEF